MLLQAIDLLSAFRETVLDVIRSVLGDSATKVIMIHIAPVPLENPREFHNRLYFLVGPGALVLERMMAKELCRRLGVPYEERGAFDFERFVNQIRSLSAVRPKETEHIG
jgi:hypothetical protein